MKKWEPYRLRLKEEIVTETTEIFSLFLKISQAFLNNNAVYMPENISKDHRISIEKDLEYFDNYTHFRKFMDELGELSKEELISVSDYYKDALRKMGQDYSFIINKPVNTPLDFIDHIENNTLKNMLRKAWNFGDEIVRTGIVNYLDGLSEIHFDHEGNESEGETVLDDLKLKYHIDNKLARAYEEKDLIKGALILAHEFYHTGDKALEKEEEILASLATMKFLEKLIKEENYKIEDENLQYQWEFYNTGGKELYANVAEHLYKDVGKNFPNYPYGFGNYYNDYIWQQLLSFFGGVGEVLSQIGNWIWGVLQGEWNEDATLDQVIVDTIITLIPIVDTVGDIRDLAAHIYFLCWKKQYNDPWRWFALVLTCIGFIPEFGTVIKGIIRILKNVGENIDAKVIQSILKLGEPIIRKLSKDLPEAINTAYKVLCDVVNQIGPKLKELSQVLKKIRDNPLMNLIKDKLENLKKFINRLDEFIAELDNLLKKASQKFDEAKQKLERILKRVLGESADDVITKISKRPYNSPSPPCFPAGVFVKTPAGDKKIDEIQIGDLVCGYDSSAQQVVACKVENVFRNWTNHLAEIQAGDFRVAATRMHRFWVENSGRWVAARDLEPGMQLRLLNGTAADVDSVAIREIKVDTYNLAVDQVNNYFVGAQGALVHNGGSDFENLDYKPTGIYALQYTGSTPVTIEVINRGQKRLVTLNKGDYFYVGKSFQGGGDVEIRFKQHLYKKNELEKLKGKSKAVLLEHSSAYNPKGWTSFETACWEQHYINQYGGAYSQTKGTKLFNSDRALQEMKYMEYRQPKYKHNPCP